MKTLPFVGALYCAGINTLTMFENYSPLFILYWGVLSFALAYSLLDLLLYPRAKAEI